VFVVVHHGLGMLDDLPVADSYCLAHAMSLGLLLALNHFLQEQLLQLSSHVDCCLEELNKLLERTMTGRVLSMLVS